MLRFFSLPLLTHTMVRTLRPGDSAVPALLGPVLLVAAALKAHQLATGSLAEDDLFTSRWYRVGLVELELTLGLWLLLGFYPRPARLLALACFTAFSAVSLHRALAGRASCGCFGMVALSPWYTLLFDLAAVTALWHWHPDQNICSCRGGYGTVVRSPGVLPFPGCSSYRQVFSWQVPDRSPLPRS